MNIEDLLHRWREGEISCEELAELTSLLEKPERREQLRQDWFLETTLPEALNAARVVRDAPDASEGFGVFVRWWKSFLPAYRWIAAGGAVAATVLVLFLGMGESRNQPLIVGDVANAAIIRGGEKKAASSGAKLFVGDVLCAGERGGMELVFPLEGTHIRLAEGTSVELRRLEGKKEFRLISGSVSADVAHQKSGDMVWVTDDALARVVGTKFDLSAEGLFTRLDVTQGAVVFQQLAGAKPTTVHAGEFAAADSQTLVEARPIAGADALPWSVPGLLTPGFLHAGFRSDTLDRDIGVNVMLPPDYETHPQRRFPVVYLLHGLGGNEHTEAARFGPALQAAMREGRIPQCIVVAPNTGPAFSHDVVAVGRMISRDLPAFIDANYRTLPFRKTRFICGVGFGAQLSVILTALHPDVFATGGAVNDTLRGGTPALERMAAQMRKRAERTPSRIVLFCSGGHSVDGTKKLAAFFDALGIETTFEVLAAKDINDPSLPALVLDTLAPVLARQWRPPDSQP